MEIFYFLALVSVILLIRNVIKNKANKRSSIVYGSALVVFAAAGYNADHRATSQFDYEILNADAGGAVVLLKDDSLTKDQLGMVADSLWDQNSQQLHKWGTGYEVYFYYRRDYKDHLCYAFKKWIWDYSHNNYNEVWNLDRFISTDP